MCNCKSLENVRKNIDSIDKEIVKLIAERSIYVKQAAKFKKDAEDVKAPQRVEMVIEKIRNLANDNNLNPNIAEEIYRKMINTFINFELEEHDELNKDNHL